jgi:hypothetical protein
MRALELSSYLGVLRYPKNDARSQVQILLMRLLEVFSYLGALTYPKNETSQNWPAPGPKKLAGLEGWPVL